MNKRTITSFLLLILVTLFMVGCFPHQDASLNKEPAGFFMGIWHGWITPISLIVSFFDASVRIYEKNNTGWWYDFGYYMAVISGFGSLALSRRQHTSSNG
jgi:hypothetical protein